MKALDTNIIVRFLVNDDVRQGRRAKRLLMRTEERGETLLVLDLVVLELVWVLQAAYGFTRSEVLDALELLAGMPVLCFESRDRIVSLVRRGRESKADLDDLLIGLCAAAQGRETTLTFEKSLPATGLFELL